MVFQFRFSIGLFRPGFSIVWGWDANMGGTPRPLFFRANLPASERELLPPQRRLVIPCQIAMSECTQRHEAAGIRCTHIRMIVEALQHNMGLLRTTWMCLPWLAWQRNHIFLLASGIGGPPPTAPLPTISIQAALTDAFVQAGVLAGNMPKMHVSFNPACCGVTVVANTRVSRGLSIDLFLVDCAPGGRGARPRKKKSKKMCKI